MFKKLHFLRGKVGADSCQTRVQVVGADSGQTQVQAALKTSKNLKNFLY